VTSPAAVIAQPLAWSTTPRDRALDAAVREIPRGAVVQSDLGLLTHVAGRTTVYWYGMADAPAPDYIVTDTGAGWDPPSPEDRAAYFAKVYPGRAWEVVSAADDVVVLRLVR
jgi:hypothetical protein